MGSHGPVPKRSQERRRRNSDSQAGTITVARVVPVPACPKGAHTIARRWYRSLRLSGQAPYYEPSDWAAALLLVDQMTKLLSDTEPIRASSFAALWSAMGDLFTTEAARRRARIEIERESGEESEEATPGVAALADFRQRMQAQ